MIHGELRRAKHEREDGWLSELISMAYKDQPFQCVHAYIVTINPGKTRAQHYHRQKEEWLALTHGRVTMLLENVNTGERDQVELASCDHETRIVYIPPLVAHAIRNTGVSEAGIVVFSRNPEDKEDTIPFEVG